MADNTSFPPTVRLVEGVAGPYPSSQSGSPSLAAQKVCSLREASPNSEELEVAADHPSKVQFEQKILPFFLDSAASKIVFAPLTLVFVSRN